MTTSLSDAIRSAETCLRFAGAAVDAGDEDRARHCIVLARDALKGIRERRTRPRTSHPARKGVSPSSPRTATTPAAETVGVVQLATCGAQVNDLKLSTASRPPGKPSRPATARSALDGWGENR